MGNELVNLINTIGFPMAMVIYFIWDKNNTTKLMADTLNKNTESINNITKVMEKILMRLGMEDYE